MDFVLDALATFRLVRLIHSDEITADLRTTAIGWTLRNGHTRARTLLTCVHCLGVWCAGAVLILRRVRGGHHARDLLALAGAASLAFDLLDPSPS